MTMPPPIVNQRRDIPSAQPTKSLALLHQVGAIPGAPGAGPQNGGILGAVITRSAMQLYRDKVANLGRALAEWDLERPAPS